MTDAYFVLRDGSPAASSYLADPSTGGPWAPDHQHGGPPSALAVLVAEQLAADHSGRSDLVALRLAAEFVGPVPVGELATAATVVRAARTAVLVDVTLASQGRDCLHARVWLVRDDDTAGLAAPATLLEIPTAADGLDALFPYGRSVEWRRVSGPGLAAPGPSAFWCRPRQPVVAAVPMSGLQRAAAIGDSASGISSELDWQEWSFLNVDLDIHLARPVRGDWLLMDAATQLGPSGAALARSTLSDVAGPVGSTLQTLVVERRRRPDGARPM